MYQIGHLQFPQPNDTKYDSYPEAETATVNNSIDDSIWAIWAEGGELLTIVYGGEVFEK